MALTTRVAWEEGTWSTLPQSTRVSGDVLVVEAVAGSDYWEKTLYGFRHDSGHSLLAPWTDRGQAVEVSFRLDSFRELYDQAGLMLWRGPMQWIKAGIELNDGVPHLGAVVTDNYSDWSLSPVPAWAGRLVTIRASHTNDAVILRAHVDGERWQTLRVARFPYDAAMRAGPFVCAPKRAGLEVSFTRWVRTAPDADLHSDPEL